MKKCIKCYETKEFSNFNKRRRNKDGYAYECKICSSKIRRKKYDVNKQKIREYENSYRAANRDKYRELNRKHYSKNNDVIKSRVAEYTKKNAQKVATYQKQYREENKETIRLYKKEYMRNRLDNDIYFKLKMNLRTRLNKAIKKNQKAGSAIRDLGCSIEELKEHLESKFQPNMAWDNWGKYGWHIDHIVPLNNFDLTNPAEVRKACHYSNLQPLWAEENLSKGSRV